MVARDRRRNIHYFEELVAEFESEMQLTQDGLDNGDFTSPTERVELHRICYTLLHPRVSAQTLSASNNILNPMQIVKSATVKKVVIS